MNKRKKRHYNITYIYNKSENALNLKDVLERLFQKFLMEYDFYEEKEKHNKELINNK